MDIPVYIHVKGRWHKIPINLTRPIVPQCQASARRLQAKRLRRLRLHCGASGRGASSQTLHWGRATLLRAIFTHHIRSVCRKFRGKAQGLNKQSQGGCRAVLPLSALPACLKALPTGKYVALLTLLSQATAEGAKIALRIPVADLCFGKAAPDDAETPPPIAAPQRPLPAEPPHILFC